MRLHEDRQTSPDDISTISGPRKQARVNERINHVVGGRQAETICGGDLLRSDRPTLLCEPQEHPCGARDRLDTRSGSYSGAGPRDGHLLRPLAFHNMKS